MSGEATAPFTGILTVAAHQPEVDHVAEGKLDEAQEALRRTPCMPMRAASRRRRGTRGRAVLACFGGALADNEGDEDSHEDDHGVAGDGVNMNADGASDVERAGERP